MAPIIKPRVPLYLRQNGPRQRPPTDYTNAKVWYLARQALNNNYAQFEAGWRQGSLCRCLECGWLGREKKLKIRFHEKVLRGFELCPRCACLKLQFFDNLTPAQEALLEP